MVSTIPLTNIDFNVNYFKTKALSHTLSFSLSIHRIFPQEGAVSTLNVVLNVSVVPLIGDGEHVDFV